MSYHVDSCGRCGAQIIDSSHRRPEKQRFYRELGGGKHDSQDIRLCSMCLDDVWECVFETEIERSEKADPIPLAKVTDSVGRHINELEQLKKELQE